MPNKIRELPEGFRWEINWGHDESGQQPDFLGEFLREDDGSDYNIDVKQGQLLGPEEKLFKEFPRRDYFEESLGWVPEAQDTDDDQDWYFEKEKDSFTAIYSRYGRPVLKEELKRYQYSDYYRFWIWDHLADNTVEEYGLDALIHDMSEDYLRHVAWTNDEWTYECCDVVLKYRGEPLAFESSCGINSDRSDEETTEIEEDLMWEAIDENNLKNLYIRALAVIDYEDHGNDVPVVLLADAKDERDAFKAFLDLIPLIRAERQAAYDKRMKRVDNG